MNSKTRLRVSYVLPSTEYGSNGHRLGVTGLAYDARRSILYSGGRDGVICSWDASLVANGDGQHGQVPAIKQVQSHSNWINSIDLACSGQAVISASSDASVKLWRPDAFDHKPNTIGTHADYVKCVASPGETQTWAASGGLDHHIITWDLTSAQEQTRFKVSEEGTEKGSIYALAASDNLVVSGGTETAIKLWDTRSSRQVSRLIGHTDIIRSILISKNQDRIITASSDRTIKIWSVAAGRCLSSLAIHSDSVWSLHSDHPSLQTFHSADKSGMVAKTEISGLADSDQSLSFALCQEHNGVSKVLSADSMVWTATCSSSINCWQDVRVATGASMPNITLDSSGVARSRERSITVKRHRDSDLTSLAARLPANCLLRVSNNPGYLASTKSTRVRGHGQRPSNVRKASLVSREPVTHAIVPARDAALLFTEGQTGFIKHVVLNDRRHVLTLDTSGAVMKWDILQCVQVQSYGKRDLHEVAESINTKDVIPNFCTVDTKSGTLNCTLTENRCLDAEVYADELEQARGHTFAPDHRVNLGKWVLRYLFEDWILEEERRDDDLRKSIGRENSSFNLSDRSIGLRKLEPPSATDSSTVTTPRLLDRSAPSIVTGVGVATPSRNGDNQSDVIKLNSANEGDAGVGTLRMSTSHPQRRSGEDYVSRLSLDHEDEASSDSSQKLPMTPTERSDNDRSTTSSELGQGSQGGVAGPSFGKRFRDTFSPRKISRSIKPQDPSKAIIVPEDKQENENTKAKVLDGDENTVDDRVTGLIHQMRRGYLQQLKEGHDKVESAINAYSTQEAPPLKIASRTRILIQEEHSHADTVTNLFEGYHGELAAQASLIESVCPFWLGRILLSSHTPPSDTSRISFFLKPLDDTLPDISEDKSEGRLTASRHTRARKTLEYVMARLQSANKMQAGSPSAPENFLELYCQDQPVPLNMTLASVRTHLWKAGGDVILHYKSTGKVEFTSSVRQRRESEDRESAAPPT